MKVPDEVHREILRLRADFGGTMQGIAEALLLEGIAAVRRGEFDLAAKLKNGGSSQD